MKGNHKSSDRDRARAREYYYQNRDAILRKRLEKHTPEEMTLIRRKYREKLRADAFNIYGAKCARCGYDADLRALVLDHINGGGNKERKGSSVAGYRRARRGHADEYQILCANCNQIKRIESESPKRKYG